MRSNHLARGAVASAAVAALALTRLLRAEQRARDTKTGSSALNVYLYQEPVGIFSPLAPSSGPDNQVQSFISQGLLGVDPSYHLQPELAQSYTVSSDAKTFTFHLRPGLKWSDGKPFTSQGRAVHLQRAGEPQDRRAPPPATTRAVQGVSDFVAGKAPTISGFSRRTTTRSSSRRPSPTTACWRSSAPPSSFPQHVLGKDTPAAARARTRSSGTRR